ncbi:unnamed protein product [Penicillium nalgiovense]|uniref:Uncharacterized protein n=2 Tax=Penicillium nalgiovense TaxID=60175 RepID=A0A9W4I5X4_PENNA|nr:unnamed protein product [Penicillium nalgiovense]CAG8062538.1 unnamed protein product [Penicillium nalgiovense]CAG8063162.1 unnamed protein product [Penicillium nalgiovense]CAG8089502.1 unnamed protein product [Penicillium nalgiovense]CAG8156348.1 unnamed protein product [Penicillium nalgiovense]
MPTPSILTDSLSENLTLASKTRHSEMSDDSDSPEAERSEVERSDLECFEALPDDTVQAIGSTESAIRKIIRENQETTNVVKYIRFTNVPPTLADKFSLRGTRQMFDRSTRYMIIKLLTGAHETASRGLGGAVQYEITNMGLRQSIRPLGSKTIQGVFCRKQADEAYGLRQPVPGRNPEWPTVVVEIGVSESYRKLWADAEWWLTNSRGDVNLVIIVSVSRKTPNIKFETVALDPTVNSLRHQRPRYVPKIRQTITVSRNANNPNSITIRPPVALTIGFEELFCRQLVPPEHNIDLSPYELGEISTDVWGEQGF